MGSEMIIVSDKRIADHAHPWDDDTNEGTISRRSFTPYLPGNPGKHTWERLFFKFKLPETFKTF